MRRTTSVCPVCLKRIPATRIKESDEYYQLKTCPSHGKFRTIVWRGSEDIDQWIGDLPESGADETLHCPDDCGLCKNHLRSTCCTLLEVTNRCNMHCRFCFADPTSAEDPSLDSIKSQIDDIVQQTGKTLLQLSGGEPTVRDDLPQIIAYAKKAGCSYVQLNTNGLRLAEDPSYAVLLAEAGLSFAFLQFDGITDDIFSSMRGLPLFAVKKKVIENCAAAGLGVTLVPVIVPGINSHQIGDILHFAIDNSPTVRGVHFQPVSYFGRIPFIPADVQRYTLGELIDDIVLQSNGLVPRSSLVPSACDHPLCGFHGDYIVMPQGKLEVLSYRERAQSSSCCCCSDSANPADKNRIFIGSRWKIHQFSETDRASAEDIRSLEGFLQRKRTYGFTITAMDFQDAGNLDFERLRQCSLHVYRAGKRIPFCAAYLTRFEI